MQIYSPQDMGLLIREQRKKLGLEQRALADQVGVSRQWIVDVEKGKPRAEIGLVLRTIKALHLALFVEEKDSTQQYDLDALLNEARGDKKE